MAQRSIYCKKIEIQSNDSANLLKLQDNMQLSSLSSTSYSSPKYISIAFFSILFFQIHSFTYSFCPSPHRIHTTRFKFFSNHNNLPSRINTNKEDQYIFCSKSIQSKVDKLFSSNNDSNCPQDTKYHQHLQGRKQFLTLSFKILASITSSTLLSSIKEANAIGIPFLPKKERIQLELCIVTVKRVQYWAMNVVTSLKDPEITPQKRKSLYLEARLGAKALLSKKIGGGGSNANVIQLASFQLRECLQDATYYCTNNSKLCKTQRQMEDVSTAIIESLASLVEFDGLDNTIDASPRSSLFEQMYKEEKADFVRKLLEFQLIPNCVKFVGMFRDGRTAFVDENFMRRVDDYMFSYYPSEIPTSILYD